MVAFLAEASGEQRNVVVDMARNVPSKFEFAKTFILK
jgi:hypothetical protein